MSHEVLRLHLIPGVSASGKTTTAKYLATSLCHEGHAAELVVPHTTRRPRAGEIHGVDYYFHDRDTFLRDALPRLNDSPDLRCSEIGGEYYFNSDSETLPNSQVPIKILPIAFSAIKEVMDDYKEISNLSVTVLPIEIADSIQERWLNQVEQKRPNRDLRLELMQQKIAMSSMRGMVSGIYRPQWLSRDSDLRGYLDMTKDLFGLN